MSQPEKSKLNKAQIEAVGVVDSPLLILAGAGTGKTTTITMRIAYMVKNEITRPENILAVTFTNQAAGEMKHRLEKMLGDEASGMWICTFHSFCVRILHSFGSVIGLEPGFIIMDEQDKERLIKTILKDLNIDAKTYLKPVQIMLSKLKEAGINADDDEDKINRIIVSGTENIDRVRLYKTYQFRLRSINAVDFDDLILEVVNIFKHHADILRQVQARFTHITVDEYQDTSPLQHILLQLLVGGNCNICCVGDEDQAIYSWRGGDIKHILSFENDFPGAKIVRLEENYRSNQAILDAAMSVIQNNEDRYNKSLKSGINTGIKPVLKILEDGRAEMKQLADDVQNIVNTGVHFREIAVLVRSGYQTKDIEEIFINNHIPYKIIGGLKFYERREIKDLMGYLRFCFSLSDTVSLGRIINVPKRGIGETSFDTAMKYIQENNLAVFDGLKEVCNTTILTSKARAEMVKFLDFASKMNQIIQQQQMSVSDIINKIYVDSGYANFLDEESKINNDDKERQSNIRMLIDSAHDYDTVGQFLDHVALVSASDTENNGDNVNLMTMHASKGREFRYVFLPDWNEGIFPSKRSIDDGREKLEEERRLAYVSITRARENFYVYTCKTKFIFGHFEDYQQSRFVDEMINFLDVVKLTNKTEKIGGFSGFSNQRFGNFEGNKNKKFISSGGFSGGSKTKSKLSKWSKYGDDFVDDRPMEFRQDNEYARIERQKKENVNSFAIGDNVFSEKYGSGKIKGLYGKFCEIKFEDGMTRVVGFADIQKQ